MGKLMCRGWVVGGLGLLAAALLQVIALVCVRRFARPEAWL